MRFFGRAAFFWAGTAFLGGAALFTGAFRLEAADFAGRTAGRFAFRTDFTGAALLATFSLDAGRPEATVRRAVVAGPAAAGLRPAGAAAGLPARGRRRA